MIQKAAAFIKDVRNEMAQVSWPPRDELTGSTKVVIVTMILVSLVVAFFDLICARLMSWILR